MFLLSELFRASKQLSESSPGCLVSGDRCREMRNEHPRAQSDSRQRGRSEGTVVLRGPRGTSAARNQPSPRRQGAQSDGANLRRKRRKRQDCRRKEARRAGEDLPEQRRRVFPARGEHPARGEGWATATRGRHSRTLPLTRAQPDPQCKHLPLPRGFPLPKTRDFMEDDAFVQYIALDGVTQYRNLRPKARGGTRFLMILSSLSSTDKHNTQKKKKKQ